jgi:hypothetical protein
MRARAILLAASAGLLLGSVASAQFPVVGARSAGMGGAVVAVADDGTALWTNPAGLARDPRIDIEIFAGAVANNTGQFLHAVDQLSSDIDRVRKGDITRVPSALAELQRLDQPGTGIVGSGTAGLMAGKSGWALGIGDVAYAGVYPTIDLTAILPLPPSSPLSIVNNATGVSFAGLEAREVRLGYGHAFFGTTLLVGGAVRYIQGHTYFVRESVFDLDASDPISVARRAFDQNEYQTNKVAFDVGAMVNFLGIARVGLVSTAINEPEFTVSPLASAGLPAGSTLVPSTLKLPRTLRAGAAVQPIGLLLVAVDYDLVESDTLIPGGHSQQFAAGVEVKLPLFAIRAGTVHDSGAVDPHWAYSAGFGLGLKMLSVNASLVFDTRGGASVHSTDRRDLGAALDARFRF